MPIYVSWVDWEFWWPHSYQVNQKLPWAFEARVFLFVTCSDLEQKTKLALGAQTNDTPTLNFHSQKYVHLGWIFFWVYRSPKLGKLIYFMKWRMIFFFFKMLRIHFLLRLIIVGTIIKQFSKWQIKPQLEFSRKHCLNNIVYERAK